MKTVIIVLIVLIVIILGVYLIYAFSNNNSYQTAPVGTEPYAAPAPDNSNVTNNVPSSTPTTPAPITPAPVTPVASATVSIKNFAFSPATLTVKVGTKVTWTNNDSVAHTVTSDSGTTLNSATLSTGQSYSLTFTAPGTYTYHCTIHPMMKAKVVVTS